MFSTNINFLKRHASRLRECIALVSSSPVPDAFNELDATARTYGYESRTAVPREIRDKPSDRDECLSSAQLTERRTIFAERFAVYAKEVDLQVDDPVALMNVWQPSAERPMRPVVTTDIAMNEIEQHLFHKAIYFIQLKIDQARKSGFDIVKHEVDGILFALDCAKAAQRVTNDFYMPHQLLCTYVGELAVALVNRGRDHSLEGHQLAKYGVTLLEALCEEDAMLYTTVSLIAAKVRGWGGEYEMKDVYKLVKKIDEKSKFEERFYFGATDAVFMHIDSRLDYLFDKVTVVSRLKEWEALVATFEEIISFSQKVKAPGYLQKAGRELLEFAQKAEVRAFVTEEMYEACKVYAAGKHVFAETVE